MSVPGLPQTGGLSRAQVEAAIAEAAVDRRAVVLVDDFLSGSLTTADVGTLNWMFIGGATTLPAGEANHPGIVRRSTGAVANTITTLYLRNSLTTGPLLPAESLDETWIFRLNTNDADTILRIGFGNNWGATPPPVAGIYLEKALADTEWFGVCRTSPSETRTAALGTIDTDWVRVRIRRVDASTVGFTLDDGDEVTVTTNIPTAALLPGLQLWNNTAADKTVDVDFFSLQITGLSR